MKDENRPNPIKTRAQIDQAIEATKEFAPFLWNFFQSLIDQGFQREEALVLTRDLMQKTLLNF